jgi:hypothetical protein
MSIVSNASPLINLAHIGKLDLFHKLYGELIVPEAVGQEVVVEGAGHLWADEVKTAPCSGKGNGPIRSCWALAYSIRGDMALSSRTT